MIVRIISTLLCMFSLLGSISSYAGSTVIMDTNLGSIEIELNDKLAPITAKNFLRYVDEGFYNGTIFHRVIPGFMIQGGGFDENLRKKSTHEPIANEAANGLRNEVGTIAMARTSQINSATAQFFINTEDNAQLNHMPQSYGYAVFGKVVRGMETVKKISAANTEARGRFQNLPVPSVVINKVYRKPQKTSP